MRVIVFLLYFLLFSAQSFAYPGETLGHIFGGFGEGYGVSAVRGGGDHWEFGLLNRRSVGIIKLFYEGEFYTGIGLPINSSLSPGLFGAVGSEYLYLGIFTLRWELNVSAHLDNYSHAEIIIGAGISI